MMDGTQRKSSRVGTLVRSPSAQNQGFKEPIILLVQNSKEIVSIPKNELPNRVVLHGHTTLTEFHLQTQDLNT